MKRYTPLPAGTWHQEKLKLGNVFRMWGVVEWTAEPNVIEARANAHFPGGHEPDVTVRFVKDGREVILTMTAWDHAPTNLEVLRLCIDDMRMLERRGLDQTMQSAYLQLAGPSGPVERDPYEVLGLRPDATRDDIEAMFKVRAKRVHPDLVGGPEARAAMVELNRAREKLLAGLAG